MKIIEERVGYLGTKYLVFVEKVNIREVFIKRVKVLRDGFEYMFLFNSSGKLIVSAFDYLNKECAKNSTNTREQSCSAIKLLYSFLEIKDKKIECLSSKDADALSIFMLGQSYQGNQEKVILKTNRSINTHNQYFNIIRSYLKFCGINSAEFFKKEGVEVLIGGNYKMVEKYSTNKTKAADTFVPPFISLEEFKRIINVIDNKSSKFKLRNKLIVELMYTRGLRLGEVLGLSIEDIKKHPDDENAGAIYLRNRVSDTKSQKSKTCMNVFSKEQYNSKQYRSIDEGGYQIVIAPESLMNKIKEYIEDSRMKLEELSEKKSKEDFKRIIKKMRADSVDSKQDNFYLFLNKDFAPLQQGGWNRELREIFSEANIKLDEGRKEKNLSHRFRHGYAMYLQRVLNKDILYIKDQMRHRKIVSTEIYLRPTPQEIINDTELIVSSMWKNIGDIPDNIILKNAEDELLNIEREIKLDTNNRK